MLRWTSLSRSTSFWRALSINRLRSVPKTRGGIDLIKQRTQDLRDLRDRTLLAKDVVVPAGQPVMEEPALDLIAPAHVFDQTSG